MCWPGRPPKTAIFVANFSNMRVLNKAQLEAQFPLPTKAMFLWFVESITARLSRSGISPWFESGCIWDLNAKRALTGIMEALRSGVRDAADTEWRRRINVVVVGRLNGPIGECPWGWKNERGLCEERRWKRTVIWSEVGPGGIESQLDVRGNDFLGQLVGTDCAVKSSVAGVKTPSDRKNWGTDGYPAPFPARKLNKKLARQTYPPVDCRSTVIRTGNRLKTHHHCYEGLRSTW